MTLTATLWAWLFGSPARRRRGRNESGVEKDPAGFWVVIWKGGRAVDRDGKVRVFKSLDGAERALRAMRKRK
jgi:hypothetical protein